MRRSIGGATQIAVGTAVGQGAILFITPLITRLYTPAELGSAGVFLAWASILTPVVSMRLEFLIPGASNASAEWLVRAALCVAATVSLLSGTVYWLLASPTDSVAALLFATTCFALGSIAVLGQSLVRRHAYSRIGISKATVGVVQVSTQVALAPGAVALQSGIALGYLLGVAPQLRYKRRGTPRMPISRSDKVGYLRKAMLLASAGLANAAAVWSPMVVLGFAFGAEAAGLYTAAQRVTIAPVGFLIAALLPVVTGDLGAVIRNGESLKRPIRRWLRLLVPLGALVGLSVVAVPDAWLIGFLGGEFRGALQYMLALVPLLFIQVVVGPLGQALVVAGKVRAQLVWDISRLAVLAISIAVGLQMGIGPLGLIWTTTVVFTLGYGSYLGVVLRMAR